MIKKSHSVLSSIGPVDEANQSIENGTIRERDEEVRIYYDGYWIRHYAPPEDNLQERKALIDSLTRRVFHHTESGINTPGERLEAARRYFELEQDPARKRINAGMLAGAIFNRATDIFTSIVELEEKGVHISIQNELMSECGRCLEEALELGKHVKHHSGEEGVDELWGEPFKAFTMPLDVFYENRYLKVAQTFRDMDRILSRLTGVFSNIEGLEGLAELFEEFVEAGEREAETMRTDEAIFTVWPQFVAAREAIENFRPKALANARGERLRTLQDGLRLANMGKKVLCYLTGVRVPMPKTTNNFLRHCDYYAEYGVLEPGFRTPLSDDNCGAERL